MGSSTRRIAERLALSYYEALIPGYEPEFQTLRSDVQAAWMAVAHEVEWVMYANTTARERQVTTQIAERFARLPWWRRIWYRPVAAVPRVATGRLVELRPRPGAPEQRKSGASR